MGDTDTPSAWRFYGTYARQSSSIHGGEYYRPGAPGTFAVYKPKGEDIQQFDVHVKPKGVGVLGILIRYVDTENHYLLTIDSEKNRTQFLRVFNGEIDVLDEKVIAVSQSAPTPPTAETVITRDIADTGWFGKTTANVRLREMPDLDGKAITVLVKGTGVHVIDEKDGWLKVDWIDAYMHHGWVYGRYIQQVEDAAPTEDLVEVSGDKESARKRSSESSTDADSGAYPAGEFYLRIATEGNRITVFKDNETIFQIDDDRIVDGTIGFYTWKNTGSEFANLTFKHQNNFTTPMIEEVLLEDAGTDSSKGSYDATEALVKILVAKGVFNEAEARAFIALHQKQSEASKSVVVLTPEKPASETVAEMPDEMTAGMNTELQKVQDNLKVMSDDMLTETRLANQRIDELEKKNDRMAQKLNKASWAQRIKFGGDIRLRYQQDYFGDNNAVFGRPDQPDELLNSTIDREQFRYRVRLSMLADLIDDREINVGKVKFGGRVTLGNEKNPVSTNDTLGDYFNKDGIVLDRAYLKWTYVPELPMWGEKFPEFSLSGGRMPNPWFYTDLVWDNDVNFEGIAGTLKTDTMLSNPFVGFLTAGIFPLQEEEFSDKDKRLYAGQIGMAYNQTLGLSGKLGLAYYEYENVKGLRNDPLQPGLQDFTAPQFQQKGNTLIDIDPGSDILTGLAADYKLVNVTGELDYDYWFPIHVVFRADYVKNIGYDPDEVASRTGDDDIDEQTVGYLLGLRVGYENTVRFGEWNMGLTYKYLEADAVLDAFTDSDFHLGGTNAKGWILEGAYGIYKNIWLNLTWITSNEINGPPFSADTLQIDLNGKF